LRFVDIGAGKTLRDLTMAETAKSIALGWTWLDSAKPTSAPSFALQRFTPPDAETGAMQALTDAVVLTTASDNNARIVSTGINRLLAVWSTPKHDLYAMPIDLNACP
jgi:hypothetical protein